ncbi:hypothetical protein TSAR_004744 [Trichomalopsis sarcophagae]|uniref:Uncharacterized protein n=1 Tax=Trichomalopsis sarcophagae TaxID=543379 RepID=A0A232FKD0_9HYME|nr:hypothetical protein TSAR_004744 [Trichomalopsis sarcophagae]
MNATAFDVTRPDAESTQVDEPMATYSMLTEFLQRRCHMISLVESAVPSRFSSSHSSLRNVPPVSQGGPLHRSLPTIPRAAAGRKKKRCAAGAPLLQLPPDKTLSSSLPPQVHLVNWHRTFVSALTLTSRAANSHSPDQARKLATRALLDSCSEISLVSLRLTNKLDITPDRSKVTISGVGGRAFERAYLKVPLFLHLPNHPEPVMFEAHCLRHLGITTPVMPIDERARAAWQDLELADRHFSLPGEIELLIEANALPEILKPGLI